jgi:hypothetical protein
MLTRAEILAGKTGQSTHKLSDGSGEVVIRGIKHAEATAVGQAREDGDVELSTALIIHHGLIEPELSLEDVQTWMQSADAGTVEMLAQAIGRLSNLFEGAPKSGVSKPRRR